MRRATGRMIAVLGAALAVAAAAAALAGWGQMAGGRGPRPVVLAATTTVQDTGLLDALVQAFTAETGIPVRPIVAGTGQALAYGRRGDADVVLVHQPAQEEVFVAAGYGIDRRPVMYNAFAVVGPASDPAGVRGLRDAAEALRRIAAAGEYPGSERVRWVSRGDGSGTHLMELALWERAGVDGAALSRGWYLETGAGMGETLLVAAEKQAYALTDDGTFAVWAPRMAVLVEGDPLLRNVYHLIRINPARHPRANADGGLALADFLTSEAGRSVIAEFGRERYGRPLFFPLAEAEPSGD